MQGSSPGFASLLSRQSHHGLDQFIFIITAQVQIDFVCLATIGQNRIKFCSQVFVVRNWQFDPHAVFSEIKRDFRDRTEENAMRKIFSLSILLITLLTLVGTADVVARGGRDNDCPPKSSDPDCK